MTTPQKSRRKFLGQSLSVTGAVAMGVSLPISLYSTHASAWGFLLRIIPMLLRGGRAVKAGRTVRSAATIGGATTASAFSSPATAGNLTNLAMTGANLYFLYDMFKYIAPEVQQSMIDHDATDLWVNGANLIDLRNFLTVSTRSYSNKIYTDELEVVAIDMDTGRRDTLFGTIASALPNQQTHIHGQVNSFESTGMKLIQARFLNDNGGHYFATKKVMIADHTQVYLKDDS